MQNASRIEAKLGKDLAKQVREATKRDPGWSFGGYEFRTGGTYGSPLPEIIILPFGGGVCPRVVLPEGAEALSVLRVAFADLNLDAPPESAAARRLRRWAEDALWRSLGSWIQEAKPTAKMHLTETALIVTRSDGAVQEVLFPEGSDRQAVEQEIRGAFRRRGAMTGVVLDALRASGLEGPRENSAG